MFSNTDAGYQMRVGDHLIECDTTHGARKAGKRKWWLWRIRPINGQRWRYFVWTQRGWERYSPSRRFDHARFVASPCFGWSNKWPSEEARQAFIALAIG